MYGGDLRLTGDLLHVLNSLLLFLKLFLLRSSQLLVLGRGGLNPALGRLVGRLAHLLRLFQQQGAFSLEAVSLELHLLFSWPLSFRLERFVLTLARLGKPSLTSLLFIHRSPI